MKVVSYTVWVLAIAGCFWLYNAMAVEVDLPPGSQWLRIDGLQTITVEPDPLPPYDPCDDDPKGDGCPCPDYLIGDTYPNCEAPPNPGECKVPYCPEIDDPYTPDLPPLGQYGQQKYGWNVDPVIPIMAPSVTLQDDETLSQAQQRLLDMDIDTGWIVVENDGIQCDYLLKTKMNLGIRGVPDSDGHLPRFYCRDEKFGGTIPNAEKKGGWIRQQHDLQIEQITIDGYARWVMFMAGKNALVRNNQLLHARNNGLEISNNYERPEAGHTKIVIAGNEIARAGQGNAKHAAYIHRGLPHQAEYRLTFIANTCYATNYSSCFKSIANVNLVAGNRFYQTVPQTRQPTDPEYHFTGNPTVTRSYTSLMVDVPGCSTETQILDNHFFSDRPSASNYGGPDVIGLRARRGIHGCDMPIAYEYGHAESTPVPDSPFWKPSFWTTNPAQRVTINGNVFENLGAEGNSKARGVRYEGTYPAHVSGGSFSSPCLLPVPEAWFERLHVTMDNNTFIDYRIDNTNQSDAYRVVENDNHSGEAKCGSTIPAGAAKRPTNPDEVFTVTNETYKF